jgi:uncharacterized membrane protein YccC
MVASLGGLAVSGEGEGATFREHVAGLGAALVAGSAAMVIGPALGRHLILTSLGIAALAAAIPALLERSHTAYAAVMTPLVPLLLDFGRAPSWTLVADRLVATLVGCALALTLGYLVWSRSSSRFARHA